MVVTLKNYAFKENKNLKFYSNYNFYSCKYLYKGFNLTYFEIAI